MEEDMKKIRTLLEEFIKKYGVTIEVKTTEISRSIKGIVDGKVHITIES